ncbi:hypothetical protein ILYODFUR_031471 [Ilyodon furcidens]|uniref:Uncharacterized protein n=1 Tax=Ilyodon furcidens TaxID=33524 RepID=A0ABV0VK99_9TELE
MLSVKQTVVTLLQTDSTHQKACDHLSCQLASAETTTQSTVKLALKISPQKMCHLHMFSTQCRVFSFNFCNFLFFFHVANIISKASESVKLFCTCDTATWEAS